MCRGKRPDDRLPDGAVLGGAVQQHDQRALAGGLVVEHVPPSAGSSVCVPVSVPLVHDGSVDEWSPVTDTMWPGLEEFCVRLADFYRDLHEHPELSLQEHRTARRVADALRPLGYEVTEQVGGTGVVGMLRNGDGPVVMVRADIDALPVAELTGLPYASTARAT